MGVSKYQGIGFTGSPLIDCPASGIRVVYHAEIDDSGQTGGPPESGFLDLWTFQGLAGWSEMDGEGRAAFAKTRDLALQPGGWNSWSAGWELAFNDTLPRKVRLIPELLRQTNREGDLSPMDLPEQDKDLPKRGWITGHFITYLRTGDRYLCIASRDGGGLPPVSYRIHRERELVVPELFCPGKFWKPGEVMAEFIIFHARGYFNFKDTLRRFYQQKEVFKGIDFLRTSNDRRPGGYESWYNHYTNINEKLILNDLDALGKTDNLIKLWYLEKQKPVVFQIDDGWEKAVGEWEADTQRFPSGLSPIAEKIEAAGCVPGLWLAPFLVTRKSRLYSERPGWLLRDKEGEPVVAGFNHQWDRQFYCLDLSRKDVLDYLRSVIDRVIDEWGFRYLKLDFLYAGCFTGSFAASGSPYEFYERACSILTARDKTASGLKVAYLGCGCPLGASYRHFPLSRIGADTRESWDWLVVKLLAHIGGPGAYVSLQDTIGRSFMDGTVYINDPDVVFLRSKNCKLRENEKELIALVNYCLGGQIMFSDDPHEVSPADVAQTRRIVEFYEVLSGDEYGAIRLDRNVFRLESRSGKTTGLINLGNRPWTLSAAAEPVLYGGLNSGPFLTDHRVKIKAGELSFAPHTITMSIK
ncbi:MAG: alpha-galactosidase [Treponema sp.]|jgi:alpha-galactosidase|nr:alpha-galactosidase [Treponema sp.]